MTTKISSYRQGEPRFGRKGHNIDTTVRVSYLTPEELEEYRSGKRGGMKVFTYEQYKDMKAQGKSNKEIAKEMNISEGTLYARLKVWKEPFGHSAVKPQKAEIKARIDSETNNTREKKTSENEPSRALEREEESPVEDQSQHQHKTKTPKTPEFEAKCVPGTNTIQEEKTNENEPSVGLKTLTETIEEKNGIIRELERKLSELELPIINPNSISAECESLANLLIKKNHDYGNSVQEQFDEYGLISILIRLDDKLRRLKNLTKNKQKIQNESLLDTMKDIAGYGVLGSILLSK